MRRIEREDLVLATANALRLLQEEVDNRRELEEEDFDPGEHWKRRRASQPILAIYAVLKRMAGQRERCMYCVDSQGSDIEHFWPKSPHSDRMYVWENLLMACAQCGRFKGTQFPRADDGSPLLIDPSAEDPWEFLDFNPETGNLNARYLLSVQAYSAKGEATVAVLRLDSREGVSAGYRKTYRHLCHLVTDWTDNHLAENYLERLREEDDHGLLGWFLLGSGQDEPAFSRFRGRYPDAWAACQQSFR
jgi:uncharacterized protein (TIGR02646 family)